MVKLRSVLARKVPPLFAQLQRRGIYPNPWESRSARRLGSRPADAEYDETVVGTCEASPAPATPEIMPDDEDGHRYADLIARATRNFQRQRDFGFFDVPNVKIWAQYGVHTSPAGNFVEVYCGSALRNPKYELARQTLHAMSAQSRYDEAVFLGPAWYHNFYHWMIDILPRLQLVSGILKQGIPVVGPPGSSGWRQETLRQALASLGLETTRIIVPGNGVSRFSRLVMPTNITHSLDISPLQRDMLRKVFLPESPRRDGRRRLYVSRRDAATRRLANEDEIYARLERRGFERIVMSELSPPEQASLFQSAEAVVGPHGAGFSNLVFCERGSLVIECFQKGHFSPSFARMAQICDLRYGYGIGKPVGGDTWLDPLQLENLLDKAGL